MMGYVPFLNGYSTHQDSLEGLYVFFMAGDVVLHSSSLINCINKERGGFGDLLI